jgi:hypothetical protein
MKELRRRKVIKFGLRHRVLESQNTNKARKTIQSLLAVVLAYRHGEM